MDIAIAILMSQLIIGRAAKPVRADFTIILIMVKIAREQMMYPYLGHRQLSKISSGEAY
jgi:hypothetical protein